MLSGFEVHPRWVPLIGFPLRASFFWKPMQRLIFTNNRPTYPGFQDDSNDQGKALKQTKAPQNTQNQDRIPAKETIKGLQLGLKKEKQQLTSSHQTKRFHQTLVVHDNTKNVSYRNISFTS